jgi:steroid 5-alpha reductase family enzyme
VTELLDQLYPIAIWIYAAITVATFLVLFVVSAPYGRHARSGWGPTIPAFWTWFIMEMPALLAFPIYFWISGASATLVNAIFILVWCTHYGLRTFVYPWRRRHASHSIPIIVPILAICFNLLNGFTNSWFLFSIHPGYTLDWLSDPRFILGIVVFITGMLINTHSDRVLLKLRKPGEMDYKVPMSGLHTKVAAPNYFGEFIEWLGFALMTWSPAGLLFAAYTFANLAPRARSHLKWYQETFPEYPKDRKAIIPYIW